MVMSVDVKLPYEAGRVMSYLLGLVVTLTLTLQPQPDMMTRPGLPWVPRLIRTDIYIFQPGDNTESPSS